MLNVILFAPLGLAMTYAGARAGRVLATGILLSIAIECAQTVIPGRDPSLRDVLMNAAGAWAGSIVASFHALWFTAADGVAARLSLAAAGAAFAVMLASAVLLEPSFPPDRYFAHWTQEREHEEPYRGRVLGVWLDSADLPPQLLPGSAGVPALLEAGAALRITVIAGPPPAEAAPIFGISDQHLREIMTLLAHGEDLIVRVRVRASDVGLDLPEFRLDSILHAVAPGDTFGLRLWRPDAGYCVAVGEAERCRLGFTVADGWRVLYSGGSFSRALQSVCRVIWLGTIFFPLGFWGRRSGFSFSAAAILLAGMIVLWRMTGLFAPALLDWGAAVAGSAAGVVAARLIRTLRAAGGIPPALA